MAEETQDLDALFGNLFTEDDIDYQGLSASTKYLLVRKAAEENYEYCLSLLLHRGCPVNASETDHDSPLHIAVRNSNCEMVKTLLKKGADVNRKDENGETPYLLAVVRSTPKIVELLLKHGADPYADVNVDLFNAIRGGNLQEVTVLLDSPEQSASSGLLGGYSPLRLAIEMSHVDIAKLLLDRGCPINATEAVPYSPLHFAVGNGSYEMVKLLLEEGADVNSKPEEEKGLTPLHRAVERRHSTIVELLLQHGADFNAEDKKGRTPLHFPSYLNDGYGNPNLTVESEAVILEIAKLLLNKGANINAQAHDGLTPLHWSTIRRFSSLADLLLSYNADVNLGSVYGFTALYFAARNGDKGIASRLLEKGAHVNAKSTDGRTALTVAVEENHDEVADVLLANGATMNCVDEYGNSPFHSLAESWGHQFEEMASVLLNCGADVNCKTQYGRTALHIAADKNHPKFVTFLLKKGAKVNCKDHNGESPLHFASDPEIIDILIKFGATVDCRSENGRTPLHRMSALGHCVAVATLLEYGADINIKCDRGLTPLDWTHYYYNCKGLSLHDTSINSDDIRDVLLRHQAKMESVGLHVEESQFSADYEGQLEELRKSCQEEVMFLRSEFIEDTSVSYYNIVRKDVRYLAKYYMDNENVMRAAELEEYRSKFPIYASMIKCQFRRGKAKYHLLKPAIEVLNQLIDLPDLCREKILDYLCDDDLAV